MTVEMKAPSGNSNFVVAVGQPSADEAGVVLPLEVERSSAEEAGVVLPRTDQVERSSAEEAGVGLPGCRAYHSIKLKDGGGLFSTLDWQLPPPDAWQDRLGSVRSAIWRTLPFGAASRLGALP